MDSRRSRRAGVAAMAGVLCLALAACVSGAPRSGVVATVDTSPAGARSAEPPTTAEPPSAGLDPVAVARGFMQAMSSMDAGVAAAWVTDAPPAQDAVRGWSESAEVHVYDRYDVAGVPSTADAGGRGGRDVRLAVRQEGTLAGSDWRAVARVEELTLVLQREGGEWRVTNPPASPWISHAAFMDVYERAMLFLAAPDERHVTPQPVFFRKPQRPPPNTEADLPFRYEDVAAVETALNLLLRRPAEDDAALTAIPPGTEVRGVEIGNAVVRVDLSPEFADGGGPGLLRVAQVVWTVTTLIRNHEVELTIDGQPPGEVGPDRFAASGTWRATTSPLNRTLPTRGGSSDHVLFTRGGRIHAVPVDGGEGQLAQIPFSTSAPQSAPTWSPQGDRIAFLAVEDGGQRLHVGAASGEEVVTTDLAGRLSAPSWTPDGTRLLALRHDGADTTLWTANASSGAARQLDLPALPRDGLVPTTIRVSPDGGVALVLGAADPGHPERGGELFTGQLTADGVSRWTPLMLTPEPHAIHSPVWVEPGVIGFVASSGSLGDMGSLWTVEKDGWDPDEVELGSEHPGELSQQLTASPDGAHLVFTVRSEVSSDQVFAIRRRGENLLPQPLTGPGPYESDADPSLSSH